MLPCRWLGDAGRHGLCRVLACRWLFRCIALGKVLTWAHLGIRRVEVAAPGEKTALPIRQDRGNHHYVTAPTVRCPTRTAATCEKTVVPIRPHRGTPRWPHDSDGLLPGAKMSSSSVAVTGFTISLRRM